MCAIETARKGFRVKVSERKRAEGETLSVISLSVHLLKVIKPWKREDMVLKRLFAHLSARVVMKNSTD
jgi:hypothetical protein